MELSVYQDSHGKNLKTGFSIQNVSSVQKFQLETMRIEFNPKNKKKDDSEYQDEPLLNATFETSVQSRKIA